MANEPVDVETGERSPEDRLRASYHALQNRTQEPTCYNKVQLIIPGIVFIPFRLIMTVVLWVLIGIVGGVGVFLSRRTYKQEGLSGCAYVLLKICIFILRVYLFCLGIYWINTEGEFVAGSAEVPIVVCNHVTWTDYLVLITQQFMHPVSRVENHNIPIAGKLLALVQSVDVDRSSTASRRQVGDEVRRRAGDASWRHPILVFPEGTCSSPGGTLEFQQGAFKLGHTVQPLALEYGVDHHDVGWTNDTTWWTWLVFLSQWRIPVTLHYLPPVLPEGRSPAAFAKEVRGVVTAALRYELSPYSLADSSHQLVADAHGREDIAEFAVGMGLIREVYPILANGATVRKLIYAYLRVADAHDEKEFTIAGWARELGLEDVLVDDLAAQYNVHPDVPLGVRDYVWTSARICDAAVRGFQERNGLRSVALIQWCEPIWAAAMHLEQRKAEDEAVSSPLSSPAVSENPSTQRLEIISPTFMIVHQIVPNKSVSEASELRLG
eukprot:TRINITY_DN29861_c0_g1_i1.p1 TRINITY_DN29861_c0_g1~~TRINITY_DN29861_c0_g1_i1.p1  ORF type:complete len:509 (+),score=135.01 TRINITY_DN29861_c0_g1_i1:46-1527(+)